MIPNNSALSFPSLLALVFITLKLTGQIDWSWWWVLAPLWGPVVLFLTALLVFIGVLRLIDVLDYCTGYSKKVRRR